MTNLKHIELQVVALREAATGLEEKLAKAKAAPVASTRLTNKEKRVKNIAAFYIKRKIK